MYAPHVAIDRATIRQKRTGHPVRFELSEQTRKAVDDYLRAAHKKAGEFLFTSRRYPGRSLTTRQYARVVCGWIAGIGLDPALYGTHSLRRIARHTAASITGDYVPVSYPATKYIHFLCASKKAASHSQGNRKKMRSFGISLHCVGVCSQQGPPPGWRGSVRTLSVGQYAPTQISDEQLFPTRDIAFKGVHR
jgi:hypothetical protein